MNGMRCLLSMPLLWASRRPLVSHDLPASHLRARRCCYPFNTFLHCSVRLWHQTEKKNASRLSKRGRLATGERSSFPCQSASQRCPTLIIIIITYPTLYRCVGRVPLTMSPCSHDLVPLLLVVAVALEQLRLLQVQLVRFDRPSVVPQRRKKQSRLVLLVADVIVLSEHHHQVEKDPLALVIWIYILQLVSALSRHTDASTCIKS